MCKVNSIWPITLVGMNSRAGITREFMINALVMLCERRKTVGQHETKQKVVGLEVERILGLANRSGKSW